GVSGSGPAYVFLMVEAMAAAGEAEGLDKDMSNILARQTIIGAAALLEEDPSEAAILRKNVTSPNGVTAEALEVLMGEQGLFELMGKAVKAAAKRNKEIGE
ncbi:Pyrroline-5-carboxylate reductase, partial [hydrothermal vent metagenome]